MKRIEWIIVILLLVQSSALHAEEYGNVEVKKLLTSTTASNGQQLSYLRTDHPEVTVLVVRVPPGGVNRLAPTSGSGLCVHAGRGFNRENERRQRL